MFLFCSDWHSVAFTSGICAVILLFLNARKTEERHGWMRFHWSDATGFAFIGSGLQLWATEASVARFILRVALRISFLKRFPDSTPTPPPLSQAVCTVFDLSHKLGQGVILNVVCAHSKHCSTLPGFIALWVITVWIFSKENPFLTFSVSFHYNLQNQTPPTIIHIMILPFTAFTQKVLWSFKRSARKEKEGNTTVRSKRGN